MSEARFQRIFGLTFREFGFIFFVSLGLSGFFYHFFETSSLWLFAGLAFSFFVLLHMCWVASRYVIFLELATFIGCVSLIIGPALAYIHPASWPIFQMVIPLDEYLSYAIPSMMALWLGLHLPARMNQTKSYDKGFTKLTPQERHLMDIFIVAGFLVTVVSSHLPESLKFFYYVLALLPLPAALTLMFCSAEGWGLRVFIVYLSMFLRTASGGIFYEMVLWAGYLMISFAYIGKWRWKLLFALVLVFFMILLLNGIKNDYRNRISLEENLSVFSKAQLLAHLFIQPDETLRDKPIGDQIVRWNQGWIVARVMMTVPEIQPYANGQTIQDALVASIVPRIFFPNKMTVISHELFTTYTGADLAEDTSMALGSAGEMYANFGRWGGVMGMGIFGSIIGLIFYQFVRFAKYSNAVWAWVPFVLLAAFQSEWNIYDIFNYVTKSGFVFLLVVLLFPSLRNILKKKVTRIIPLRRRTSNPEFKPNGS